MSEKSVADTVFPMIAMPLNHAIPSPTLHSLLRSQRIAMEKGIALSFNTYDGCSLVHKARNCLVTDFLNSECTHLFWIDGDLVWEPEVFLKFVILGPKHDMLAGAYPKKDDKPTFYMAPISDTILTNEYGCIEIKRIAAGFSIVQRRVIEHLAEKAPKVRFDYGGPKLPRIYRCDVDDDEERGEDMAFCNDVRAAGFKIWLDPSVAIGHHGTKTYDHKIMDQMKLVDAPSSVAKCA